jgi:hypothetical protein
VTQATSAGGMPPRASRRARWKRRIRASVFGPYPNAASERRRNCRSLSPSRAAASRTAACRGAGARPAAAPARSGTSSETSAATSAGATGSAGPAARARAATARTSGATGSPPGTAAAAATASASAPAAAAPQLAQRHPAIGQRIRRHTESRGRQTGPEAHPGEPAARWDGGRERAGVGTGHVELAVPIRPDEVDARVGDDTPEVRCTDRAASTGTRGTRNRARAAPGARDSRYRPYSQGYQTPTTGLGRGGRRPP